MGRLGVIKDVSIRVVVRWVKKVGDRERWLLLGAGLMLSVFGKSERGRKSCGVWWVFGVGCVV